MSGEGERIGLSDASLEQVRAHIRTLPRASQEQLFVDLDRARHLQVEDFKDLNAVEAALQEGAGREAARIMELVGARQPEIRAVSARLQAVQCGVEVDSGKTPARLQRLLAMCDMELALERHHVSQRLMAAYREVDKADGYADRWAELDESIGPVAEERAVSREHVRVYIRVAVLAGMILNGGATPQIPAEEMAALEAAMREFHDTFVTGTSGERFGLEHGFASGTLKETILAGLKAVDRLGKSAKDELMREVDVFLEQAGRHEHSKEDMIEVRNALKGALGISEGQLITVEAEITKLQRLIEHYSRGPVQLEALEQQWRSYRINKLLIQRLPKDEQVGSLQPATVEALKVAKAYCWSQTPVEAVSAAATALPPEMALSETALGDLAAPGGAGWWWFEEPLPIKTTRRSGAEEPVVALLWRREIHAERGPRIWFTTLVWSTVTLQGRDQLVPVTTTAWVWDDGMPLSALEAHLRTGYEEGHVSTGRVRRVREGVDAADMDETISSSMWFSRFFLAGAAWLRQRIAVTERAQGLRQVARGIQREHKLADAPRVEIVHLRRRESARHEATGQEGTRNYTCRWVVEGFWRNQFYPSRREHAPKYIESYMKGPEGAPLKTSIKVYAVQR